jgi:hypothetical protein
MFIRTPHLLSPPGNLSISLVIDVADDLTVRMAHQDPRPQLPEMVNLADVARRVCLLTLRARLIKPVSDTVGARLNHDLFPINATNSAPAVMIITNTISIRTPGEGRGGA